jgi:neutral ceramidase
MLQPVNPSGNPVARTFASLCANLVMTATVLIATVMTATGPADAAPESEFSVGAGIHDITGPVADVMMMGYVDLKQTTRGIHTRLNSRAFVIEHAPTGKRAVMVTIDQLSVPDAVKTTVLEKLRSRFGDLYSVENTLMSATHTHSGPGGFSHYVLYDVFSAKGFSEQNFKAIVDGIYASIVKAHQNLTPAVIFFAEGQLDQANISRSADAYLLNPTSERSQHNHNVDKTMTLLKFTATNGTPIGILNWFAVHAVSMKKTNRLISSDNKGWASLLFEKALGRDYRQPDGFVAAFANSNAGDVSPSSGGAHTDVNGDWVCALKDNFKCTESIARKQYQRAVELYRQANETLSGGLDFRHKFVDMSQVLVRSEFANSPDGLDQRTCFAGIGLSMLAGTKDGWGIGREKQTCSDPSLLGGVLCSFRSCHGEKPVVLATGLKTPYPWTPQILPLQIMRLGSLAIIAVPAEFTTMSGRRLRNTVQSILAKMGVRHAVIAGYSNSYAGYVATREEYQMQNYEGASTHFGEWTLAAYQQEFAGLAQAMSEQADSDSGPNPLDSREMREIRTPLIQKLDRLPRNASFGGILTQAKPAYVAGETVAVDFWAGHPNNDLMHQRSYLEVQKVEGNQWISVAMDWDIETQFIWTPRTLGAGKATVQWSIPLGQAPGNYRIVHRGVARPNLRDRIPYQGVSRTFQVR